MREPSGDQRPDVTCPSSGAGTICCARVESRESVHNPPSRVYSSRPLSPDGTTGVFGGGPELWPGRDEQAVSARSPPRVERIKKRRGASFIPAPTFYNRAMYPTCALERMAWDC